MVFKIQLSLHHVSCHLIQRNTPYYALLLPSLLTSIPSSTNIHPATLNFPLEPTHSHLQTYDLFNIERRSIMSLPA